MNFIDQIQTSFLSPWKIHQGSARFFGFLTAYALLSALILGSFALFLIQHQDWLKARVMDYLLPASWHGISDWLISFFFESQTKIVLAGLITNGSLIVISILLFPLKEHCSYLFEKDISPTRETPKDFPLWLQAIEETKILFLYLVAQSLILAIGYYPYEWSSWLSSALSILFLCFTFGLDYISPTLQRHRIKYNAIIKGLARHWPLTMIFGALFTLPVLYTGQWLLTHKDIELAELTAILFGINILFLVMAIPAGTYVASRLRDKTPSLPVISAKPRRLVYVTLASVLLLSGGMHYLVASSMHHKSQILKCHYDIDWSSMSFNSPGFSNFFSGDKSAELEFNLEIHNPTAFDLYVEDSTFTVTKDDYVLSNTEIRTFKVGSGQTVQQPMKLSTQMDISAVSNFARLTQGWKIQLQFDLLPGIPFILILFEQEK